MMATLLLEDDSAHDVICGVQVDAIDVIYNHLGNYETVSHPRSTPRGHPADQDAQT